MVGRTLRCQHLFSFLMSNAEPNKKVMRNKISIPFIYLLHSPHCMHNRELKQRRRRQLERQETIGLRQQNKTWHVLGSRLFVHFFAVVDCTNFTLLKDQRTRQRFSTFLKTQIQSFKLNYIIIHYYLTNRTTRMKSDEILKQREFTFQETFSTPVSASLLKLPNTITSHEPLESKTIRRHMMVVSFLERRLSGRSANTNVLNIRCAFRVSIKNKNNWQVPSDTKENSFQIQETRLSFFSLQIFKY